MCLGIVVSVLGDGELVISNSDNSTTSLSGDTWFDAQMMAYHPSPSYGSFDLGALTCRSSWTVSLILGLVMPEGFWPIRLA